MALLSMTGFGSASRDLGTVRITVELKSVNHRYLDLAWRLPAIYSSRELSLAKVVREKLRRGRVEITVSRAATASRDTEVRFNQELFDRYLEVITSALDRAGHKVKATEQQAALQILGRREVLEVGGSDESAEQELPLLDELLAEAIVKLVEMRTAEGRALEREIASQLSLLEQLSERIATLAAETPVLFAEKLKARLQRFQSEAEVDPMRLAQEVAILADRVDVTEELARLRSHIAQFKVIMATDEPGKRLDFLLQELGREINTTGSKSQSGEIAKLIVEAKALLEKIREQVQNVE